jgi:hypothetical protein
MTDTINFNAIAKSRDYGPLTDMVQAMQAQITREVLKDVLAARSNLVTEVAQTVTQAMSKMAPPIIHVDAPPPATINVAAPIVTPRINIETPGEDDAGQIEAMQANTKALLEVKTELLLLRQLLARPVTKSVHRDDKSQITSVTETR